MPSRAATPSEREHLLLLLILVVSLAIRVTHFLTIIGTAIPRFPLVFDQSDMHTFWEWAQTILAGDWLGRDTYHPAFNWMKAMAPQDTWYRWWGGKAIFQQAPLYPYFVAGLLAISRNSLEFVLGVQLVLGAFQPLVVFALARRLFDGRVGLVAAALTAVYGPFVFHQGVLLRDWLPPLLEPLALLALLRARASGRAADSCLSGAALGVALLAREAVLPFIVVALLWIVLDHGKAVRRATASSAALLLGLLLALSPLIARNAVVGAPLLALSNRPGEAFIVGYAADGFPIGLIHPPSMKTILERSGGRTGAVILETLRTYGGDWHRLVDLQLLRLRAFADPFEVPNNVSVYYGLEISPVLRLTLSYGVIFPLGLAGFVLSLGVWRRHLLLALYGLCTTGGLVATTIVARYRLTIVPVLIIYGAAGLIWMWEVIRARRVGGGVTYVCLLLGFVTLQQLVLPIPTLRENPSFVIYPSEYLVAADIYARDGRLDLAVREVERLEARAAERAELRRARRRGVAIRQRLPDALGEPAPGSREDRRGKATGGTGGGWVRDASQADVSLLQSRSPLPEAGRARQGAGLLRALSRTRAGWRSSRHGPAPPGRHEGLMMAWRGESRRTTASPARLAQRDTAVGLGGGWGTPFLLALSRGHFLSSLGLTASRAERALTLRHAASLPGSTRRTRRNRSSAASSLPRRA